MKTEYKGYEIFYNENNEKFSVIIGESRFSSEKLSQLKIRIDNFEKQEKKFKRIDVLCQNAWSSRDEYVKGVITSIRGEEYGSTQIWVTYSKKKRQLRSLRNIYHYNDKNIQLYEEVKKLKLERSDLDKRIDSLFGKMDAVTKEDLKNSAGE